MKAWRQHWGPAQQRHALAWAVVALLGAAGVVWVFGPAWAEVDALEMEVAQWQSQSLSPPRPASPVQPATTPTEGETGPAWPEPAHASALWPWLQQRLQAQGLQVQALRPQAINNTVPALPEQAVVLQLQGRWTDWHAWIQDMAQHAPWWQVDQWQVVPLQAGQVRIELQARVGLWPAGLAGPERPGWSAPAWAAARAVPTSRDTLWDAPDAERVDRPSAASAPASSDPRAWPVRALRLHGVWLQADQWHAVLGDGLAQTTVRAGQRIGQEGFRVRRIGENGVELVSGEGEPTLRLDWQGGQP